MTDNPILWVLLAIGAILLFVLLLAGITSLLTAFSASGMRSGWTERIAAACPPFFRVRTAAHAAIASAASMRRPLCTWMRTPTGVQK